MRIWLTIPKRVSLWAGGLRCLVAVMPTTEVLPYCGSEDGAEMALLPGGTRAENASCGWWFPERAQKIEGDPKIEPGDFIVAGPIPGGHESLWVVLKV